MLILTVPTESGREFLMTKLENVYPECAKLIRGCAQLHPLICLKSSCHMNNACMETLALRVNLLFDAFPNSEILVLYFKYQDTKSLRGGVFWKDMKEGHEPRLITINPWSWQTCKDRGTVYEWNLPRESFL